MITLPIPLLVLGGVAFFLGAGVLGRPIISFLRNRGWLNAQGVHGAAFVLAIVFFAFLNGAISSVTTPPIRDSSGFCVPCFPSLV